MTKCNFIMKKSSFKMLVVFAPIFVADTKITFVYNFVAPLKNFSSDLTYYRRNNCNALYSRLKDCATG